MVNKYSMTLEAGVEDEYSNPLDSLADKLSEIGKLEEKVFPITADAKKSSFKKAEDELEDLEDKIDDVEGNVNVSANSGVRNVAKSLNDLEEEYAESREIVNVGNRRLLDGYSLDSNGEVRRPNGEFAAKSMGEGVREEDVVNRESIKDTIKDAMGEVGDTTQVTVDNTLDSTGVNNAIADGDEEDQRVDRLNAREIVDAMDEFGADLADPTVLLNRGRPTDEGSLFNRANADERINVEKAKRLALTGDEDERITAVKGLSAFGDGDTDTALDKLEEINAAKKETGQLSRFRKRIERTRLTMSTFYDILATLIPLIGVFVGAMPAAIAGLSALATVAVGAAAGLASIAGLGALGILAQGDGSMKPLKKEIREITDTFANEFRGLATRLAPLVRGMFDDVQGAIRGFAQQEDAIVAFSDEFEQISTYLAETLPSAFGDLLRFGDRFSNIFGRAFARIEGLDFFGMMGDFIRDTAGSLGHIANEVLLLMPAIINLSKGFLDVAAAMLFLFRIGTMLIGGVTTLLNILIPFVDVNAAVSRGLGMIAASGFALVTVLLTLVKVHGLYTILLQSTFLTAIKSATLSMYGYAQAHLTAASAMQIAKFALVSLLAVTGIGLLVAGVGMLVSEMTKFGKETDNAKSSLEDLKSMKDSFGDGPSFGSGGDTRGGEAIGYRDVSETTIVVKDADEATRVSEQENFDSNMTFYSEASGN